MRYPIALNTTVLAVLLATTGCSVGPDPAHMRAAAATGQGADIELILRRDGDQEVVVRGELLAIDANRLLVLREQDIAQVAWMDVNRAELTPPVPRRHFGRDLRADGQQLRRVRAVSRFPQGVTAEMLGTLVRHYGPLRPVGRGGVESPAQ